MVGLSEDRVKSLVITLFPDVVARFSQNTDVVFSDLWFFNVGLPLGIA